MAAPRTYPSHVLRRLQPDANAVRQHWRALADDAVRMARGAVNSDGMTMTIPGGFLRQLNTAPPFPAGREASPQTLAAAFVTACKALLEAQPGQRRAICGRVVEAAGDGVERMLVELVQPQLAFSRRITGEAEEE